MIVDASAILAIMLEEEDGDAFEDALLLASERHHVMSPVNYLEAAIRLDGLENTNKGAELDAMLNDFGVDLVDVTPKQARLAREAYARYGKGNHKARLNLGDCFAYALARARGEKLLFKGEDFRLTDVEAAL
ncbi:type II toxin-antitoxin system VapC family toxin [Aquamicrobium sp.]|uniref:type II toxin-antitoxin system VapC family toxin n=1 Tax=Aquamicrobium sp. TaxID=1872579 RepID=UPI00349E5003